jgi:hypothetical protein
MNNTEGLQPDPLVDMMVEELDALCRQLKDIVENLKELIRPEWSVPLTSPMNSMDYGRQ